MKSSAASSDLVVDRLHPLLRQRAGVLDPLLADAAERGSSVASSSSVAQEWMTPRGPNRLLNCGKSSAGGQFGQLRLLLGVQVVEVAEELVEAVHGRQVLVRSPRWFLPNCPVA